MMTACALAVSLVIAADDPGAAPVEALVLGLRAADRTLETFFVDAGGVAPLGRGLVVPRKSGWWKVDVVKTRPRSQDRWFELVASPAGRKLRPHPGVVGGETGKCEGGNEVTVHFAGPEWISFEDARSYECEGDLRPNIDVGAVTRPLGELALQPGRRDPGDPFGAAIGPDVQKAVEARLATLEKPADSPCPPEAARMTAIVRHRGRWAFEAEGSNSASVCRGDRTRFVIDAPVPRALVGHDALPQPFERYAAERPDAVDALASPSGALSVLVTAAGIEVLASGRPAIRHALPGRTVVMAQWAVGAQNVQRWRRDAAAALRP